MNYRFLIILLIAIAIDIYFYQAIATVIKNISPSKRNFIFYTYWSFTALGTGLILFGFIVPFADWPKFMRIYVTAFFFILLIAKLIGSLFLLVDDVQRLIRGIARLFSANTSVSEAFRVSRLQFLSSTAIVVAAIPFFSMIYGMIKGGFDIRIRKVVVKIKNLPDSFVGFKMAQVSDIHCGSFTNSEHFENAAKLIDNEKPDILFFTGDLVNDKAIETEGFIETFKKFKAPMGVYSVLGNHDYGDYAQWESAEIKQQNLQNLKEVHAKAGWKLLLNEHVELTKNNESIALLGVENWGARGFTKYGDLKKAYAGSEKYATKILLSHDPSHWDAQVRLQYPDIDLTLSGHTHGMQFGIEVAGIKWSPVKYIYKQWAGLYSENNQHIYVNRGLGFIGYPGRVGIWPEITIIELQQA
ncbi:MAG: metallophosphoesterase [Bacteroidota bacterium]